VGSWKRWLYLISGLAAVLVAAAAAAQAVRLGSWAPVVSVAWLPAVIIAGWPGTGRCRAVIAPRPGRAAPRR
jgi:hypothetical protein